MNNFDSTCWTVIRNSAQGDRDARAEFAATYQPAVKAYLKARWSNSLMRGSIDDAVQEVFLECFKQNGPLQRATAGETTSFRAYFYGIVRNIARRFESRLNQEDQHGRLSDLDVVSDESSLSMVFDRSWAIMIMKQAGIKHRELAQQKGKEANRRVELLALRFQQGLPIRHIADEWNVDPVGLHREYAKAREEFRTAQDGAIQEWKVPQIRTLSPMKTLGWFGTVASQGMLRVTMDEETASPYGTKKIHYRSTDGRSGTIERTDEKYFTITTGLALSGNDDILACSLSEFGDVDSEETKSFVFLDLETGEVLGEPIVHLIQLLAEDPKWEVRKEVAKLIPHLTDVRFRDIIEILLHDANSFVRNTAQQGRDRQQAVKIERQRRKRDLDEVAVLFARMEKRHGTAATQMARRIVDRLYDLQVGATVHNMRGILTSLKVDSEKLEKLLPAMVTDRTALRSMRRIFTATETLERLVNDLRTYSRPVPEKRCRERLIDLVTESCQLVKEDFQERGFCAEEIVIDVSIPETITLDAARHQLVVALTNLLNNAFDALIARSTSDTKDRITITGSLTFSGEIALTIDDNGIGFGAEELAQIRQFIPGQTTLKQDGTGFGLPTAKRYLAAHGGTLQIESEPDVGTTVLITLPRTSPEEVAA